MSINRREWIQRSLLASTALLLPKISIGESAIAQEFGTELLRLHWNENPFGPPQSVVDKVKEAASSCNLYWDEKLDNLKDDLAKTHSLMRKNYFITSGSTEILALLGQHVGLQKGEILTPWPSFPTMMIFGERCGATIKRVELSDNTIDLNKLKEGISGKTKLIFICNPNNPTSTEIGKAELESFIRAVPEHILIAIDEAYIEFSKQGTIGSMVHLVNQHSNLIICRTFSKAYGLAGFRLGYAISAQPNILELERRYPALGMAPGLLPTVAGITAFQDQEFIREVVKETNLGKSKVYAAFDNWGVQYHKSSTNFIYARDERFVSNFRARLKDSNILITKWPTMKDHIRISIGKPEWMDRFVDAAASLRI